MSELKLDVRLSHALAFSLLASVAACSAASDKGGTSGAPEDPFRPAVDDAGSPRATDDDSGVDTNPQADDAGESPSPSTSPESDAGSSADTSMPAPVADAGGTTSKDAGSTSSKDAGKTWPKDSGSPAIDSGSSSEADSGTAAIDSGPTPPPVTSSTTEFAPYFYTWGWGSSSYAFTSLVDMQKKAGVNAATLAFVLGSGCSTTRDIQNHKSDVSAFVAAGGHVKASFGGASGTYLENTCSSASALANAITAFVDETGITDLDFDVEQSGAMSSSINTMRSTALAEVQKSRGIKVSFTLAAEPSGMSSAAYTVVKSALAAGVTISHVNLMTMDYGGSTSSGKKMGDLAVSGVKGCLSQLQAVIPGLGDAAGYQMIGATPMIGQNDVSSEVFSLADATILANFAKANHLGLVSFWAIQRDQACSSGLASCSMAQTADFQFSDIFKTVL